MISKNVYLYDRLSVKFKFLNSTCRNCIVVEIYLLVFKNPKIIMHILFKNLGFLVIYESNSSFFFQNFSNSRFLA